LSVFPWADFCATRGAIKLHVGLNHDGYLPTFLTITEGRVHEVNPARTLTLLAYSGEVEHRFRMNVNT
jgi:hypothetical protein